MYVRLNFVWQSLLATSGLYRGCWNCSQPYDVMRSWVQPWPCIKWLTPVPTIKEVPWRSARRCQNGGDAVVSTTGDIFIWGCDTKAGCKKQASYNYANKLSYFPSATLFLTSQAYNPPFSIPEYKIRVHSLHRSWRLDLLE